MSMASLKELELDLLEWKKLRSFSERSIIQVFLDEKIIEISKKMEQLRKGQETSKLSTSSLPLRKIPTYAWDQSDKFVKIYVTLTAVEAASRDQITTVHGEDSISLFIRNVNNSDYHLSISGLLHEIEPEKSYFKQKKDMVLLMLKKKVEGCKWETITKMDKKSIEKKTPKIDKNADPQDSLMSMMKQMYEDGDDEMKRTIGKAWRESQNKQKAGLDNFGM